jgi:hypothetical protein
MNISQSLLKGLLEYRNGKECGLVFKAKYLDGRYDLFLPSDAQNVGAWFEYMATGSIPKDGKIPLASYMKRGKDEDGNPRLEAEYDRMLQHIENYKRIVETYGFETIRVGEVIKTLLPDSLEIYGEEVWLTGVIDVRSVATNTVYGYYENQKVLVAEAGQEVVIDIKTTGLLDDKWNDFGWELGNLSNKIKLVTQPVHYKFIEKMNSGEERPFLFFLFSSKDSNDARIIDFKVDETSYNEHLSFIHVAVENMLHIKKHGVKALPSLGKCSACPLRSECQYRATVAPITVFYFATQP